MIFQKGLVFYPDFLVILLSTRGGIVLKKRFDQFNRIVNSGIIAVIRAESAEIAIKIADAVRIGGIEAIEITMTVPGAIEVIKEVKRSFSPEEVIIGAGTVLDSETARACILAGAEYIVSPHLNKEVVKVAKRYDKIVVPGAMTIKEVVEGMESGADAIKIFPSSLFGPNIIKAIKDPLPHANLIPTGGVSLENVDQWIEAGSLAVGVGGALTKQALKNNDFDLLTKIAANFVEKIAETRRKIASAKGGENHKTS